MSAPAAALRPPCGRPGSPSRPRHRCIKAGAEGVALPEGSYSEEINVCGPAGRWSQRRSGGGRGPYQAAEGRKADGRDGAGRRERGERRAGRWGRTGRRGFLLLFLLMRVFSAAGNFAVFLKETSARRREVVLSGDGWRREGGGVPVARYPPEKSALGEGEGEPPLAPAATEWRPQAVPVATKEATGIDSRDEGVPPPPERTRAYSSRSRSLCAPAWPCAAAFSYHCRAVS